MPTRRPKQMTLEQAIRAVSDYLEKIYGITDAPAGGVVLKDGTWIEFRSLKTKTGELWTERLMGRIFKKQITDYSAPIIRDVVILNLYDGNPYPVTTETSPGMITTDTPCRPSRLALVAWVVHIMGYNLFGFTRGDVPVDVEIGGQALLTLSL